MGSAKLPELAPADCGNWVLGKIPYFAVRDRFEDITNPAERKINHGN